MIDIRLIRDEFEATAALLARRGVDLPAAQRLRDLDIARRAAITEADELRARQNLLSKQIGAAKGDDRTALMAEVRTVSARLKELDPLQDQAEQALSDALLRVPNLPHPNAPDGFVDSDAVQRDQFGERPSFDFDPVDHVALGEAMCIIDVARAVRASGSRFAYLMGKAVLLQLALVRYALDRVGQQGFVPVIPPVLTRAEPLRGTAFLPTGEDQIYRVPEDDLYLVGTSEVALAALHMDEILDGDQLPLRYAGMSTCFRREAGTYGKDTTGIFRLHQFDKIEMFSFVRPEDSWDEHERLRDLQRDILAGLGLHGRIMDIAVGDLGDSAARKYDIEVWLPGQQAYRELTSASNCTDYQARRLRCRYRTDDGAIDVVHTLNGTAVAVGRTIIAVLETHQRADGSVAIPEALQPYYGSELL